MSRDGESAEACRARALRDRGSRVGLRRALVLVAMTVVLPGSAQLQAGNRRLGRMALRVWGALVVLVVAAVVWAAASPHAVVGWATTSWVLGLLRVLLVLGALAMAVLLVDAWRIGRPVSLRARHRAVAASLTTALVLGIGGPLLIASSYVGAEQHVISTVFGSTKVSAVADNRLNIMLMGGDAGPDRSGVRPDSLSLVSIDVTTGKPVIVGLPRNLENVPFPKGTTMHRLWPQGFNCGNACLLNGIWTWASNNATDFPGVANPGLTATEQAVTAITGLKVNYYVMVDLRSFESLVDALGGITLRSDVAVPIGGETSPITGWIEPGLHHLDGYHALWFARSRSNSSDYARMARQKCVEQAMLTQLNPQKVIAAFRQLAGAAATYTRTDIPASQLGMLAGLAEQARSEPLHKVDLTPPAIPPGNPDWTRVRAIVAAAVASTRATPEAGPTAATARRSPSAPPAGGARVHAAPRTGASSPASTGTGTTSTVDGQAVCSVPR